MNAGITGCGNLVLKECMSCFDLELQKDNTPEERNATKKAFRHCFVLSQIQDLRVYESVCAQKNFMRDNNILYSHHAVGIPQMT